jgi:hypothetical protein
MSIQTTAPARYRLNEIIREKAVCQAADLRRVADFIECNAMADTNTVFTRNGPVVAVFSAEEFDRVMQGRQITLTPTSCQKFYDADGDVDGITIRCFSYRRIPSTSVAPLLCICGEKEVS